MDKRVFLITCRICNRRKHIKSRIFFENAIGTKGFSIHNMSANHAIRRRELDVGIVGKTNFVINKEHDKAVRKETEKDDYR